MEEWKDIEGYEGLYQVSDWGRVRRLDTEIEAYSFNAKRKIKYFRKGRILKLIMDKDGYLCINLCKSNKIVIQKVHRLVAKAFIPNPNDLPEVNHKDECKSNNFKENLEWCNRSHNMKWNDLSLRIGEKLKNKPETSKKVYQYSINGELLAVFASTREAERQGYNHGSISNCVNGRVKTYKGCLWKYE